MKFYNIRALVYCSLMAMAFTNAPHAQERSAGGSGETQMTWSALKNLVDTARSESTAAHDRLNQMLVCNKQQMIYAPGVKGATTDGCISNTDLSNVITCGDSGMVYDKSAKKCVDPSADSIACAKKNQFYNGTGCVDIKVSAPSCEFDVVVRLASQGCGTVYKKISEHTISMNSGPNTPGRSTTYHTCGRVVCK